MAGSQHSWQAAIIKHLCTGLRALSIQCCVGKSSLHLVQEMPAEISQYHVHTKHIVDCYVLLTYNLMVGAIISLQKNKC